eukprot:8889936-Heterocapsa_arctica.AAC.1
MPPAKGPSAPSRRATLSARLGSTSGRTTKGSAGSVRWQWRRHAIVSGCAKDGPRVKAVMGLGIQ